MTNKQHWGEVEKPTNIPYDQGEYRGWIITYSDSRPKTGRWSGQRFGVQQDASSLDTLKQSIDNRIKQYPSSGGA